MELTLDQALQKGIEAHKAGQVQEADRCYNAILKANPKHPDANHNMGALAVGIGKVQEALPFFKTALEANPKIAQFWLSYIDALIKLDRMTDAEAVFEQAKKTCMKGDGFNKIAHRLGLYSHKKLNLQEPPKNQLQSLIDLYTQEHLQQALAEASLLLNNFPNSVTLLNIIGTINCGIGKLDEAIATYHKAISIMPTYAEAYNNMGIALKEQGRLDEAIEAFNKALSLQPTYAEAYNNMGIALKDHGKLDEAIEAYTKALSIKPNYAEAYYNMGNALQAQGKLDEAVQAYTKAISIKPDYANAYYNIGVVLQDHGKLNEAIEAYNKVLSINPDYANAHYNIGVVLQDHGKLNEAIEAYNKVLSINPDYANAYNNITELLKIYTPKIERSLNLFNIDSKIKRLSPRILYATTNEEIIKNLSEGLNYISEESLEYKTPLSQIYKRNEVDLNCKRHLKIFNTKDIIPEFCFGCFKVQVDVTTVIDLIKVTSLFYKLNFEEDLTRKTLIELRPNISGTYKGLIYCRGLDQAQAVKILLDISLKEVFGEKNISKIKRGCSEYPIKFHNYGEIPKNPKDMMKFPKEWRLLEEVFDQNELIEPKDTNMTSLAEFCLSDFHIIQKWIDYAKGIGDQSIEAFSDRPIIFTDIYEKAKIRAISQWCV